MNAREGMRRLGIVLGCVGGILGAVAGYFGLQNFWSEHTRFDRLRSSAVMHDVATAIKTYQGDWFMQKGGKCAYHSPTESQTNVDIQKVLNDPDFQGLPLPEKEKVLMKLDPEFVVLTPQERAKALEAIQFYGALSIKSTFPF